MKIIPGHSRYRDRLKRATEAMVGAYADSCQAIIREPRRWPGFENFRTIRSDGSVVQGAFRNIVDTEDLANSQQTTTIAPTLYNISWGGGSTPALGVHGGQVTEDGFFIPGRPWTQIARRETDLVGAFIDGYSS